VLEARKAVTIPPPYRVGWGLAVYRSSSWTPPTSRVVWAALRPGMMPREAGST